MTPPRHRLPDRRPSAIRSLAFPSSTPPPARSGRACPSPPASRAAARMDKIDRNIYCIIGDGESPRGADLGSRRLHRRSCPDQRRPDLQLQRAGPERLGLARSSATRAWPRSSRRSASSFASSTGTTRATSATRSTNCTSSRTAAARWRSSPAPSRGGARPASRAWASTARRSRRTSSPKILGELDQTAKDLGVGDYKLNGELKITPPKATADSAGVGPTSTSRSRSRRSPKGWRRSGWTRTWPPASRSPRARRTARRWWPWAPPTRRTSRSSASMPT